VTLIVNNLGFSYGKAAILNGVDLSVGGNEVVSVIGPNGAGKSTLLKCILRLLNPGRGEVMVNGRKVDDLSRKERALSLAYVPQALPSRFPMTVFDTVLLGRRPHLAWRPSSKDVEKVWAALARMDLDALAMRDFDTLSGGQKQKVMLARAFAQEAEYLLLDEPTSNLDLRHQMEVMNMVREYAETTGRGALVTIHNLNTAARFSDRIVMLQGGKVHDCGPPADVLSSENIQSVYGVVVESACVNGSQVVIPLRVA
jgi:iron complex transport system ATP-binding protein